MPKRVLLPEGEEFMQKEGLGPEVAAWEDGQREGIGPGQFEWWYFDAHFDDGSTAVIVFFSKPLIRPDGPLAPGLMITITAPDGEKLVGSLRTAPDEFSAAREHCAVRIGASSASGDLHRYEIHAAAQDLAVELTFEGIVPPWRPGVGKTFYSEDLSPYFAWLPALPFGTASGSLTYRGQTHPVSGTCYHDHNWGTIGLPRVMSHWYWGRAHLGDFHTIFVQMTTNKAYGEQKLPVFLLAQDQRILTGDGRPLTLALEHFVRHSSGREYPAQLDFHWQGPQGSAHIALRRPQIIEATSLLSGLPSWQRIPLRLVMNPYYFRFNAEISLDVDLAGVKASQQGQALYELMLLR